jgi:hypothetical protein
VILHTVNGTTFVHFEVACSFAQLTANGSHGSPEDSQQLGSHRINS